MMPPDSDESARARTDDACDDALDVVVGPGLRHKLRTWRALSWREQRGFVAAWWRIWGAEVAIHVLPFARLARRLGTTVDPDRPAPALPPDLAGEAMRIGGAVRRAARYSPLPAKCLVQAMVVRALLARAGIDGVIRLGVRRGADGDGTSGGLGTPGLSAHAWVEAGDQVVVGGRSSLKRFTAVAAFAFAARRPGA